MKLFEIFENQDMSNQDCYEIFKQYLKNDYLSDLYALANQPDKKDQHLTLLLKLHTLATKQKKDHDLKGIQDYFDEIESLLPILRKLYNILKEFIVTENTLNKNVEETYIVLDKHRSGINRLAKDTGHIYFNNKMIINYGDIVRTADSSLPESRDIKNLPNTMQFVTDLNKLYTTDDIISRFSSFAHLTINFLPFNETITAYIAHEDTPQLSAKELDALTVSLSAPIQRLTRLMLLTRELNKEDKLELFKKDSSSLLRKLLRVCQAINQLQKISELELKHKKNNLNALDRFFTLLDKTFIAPQETLDNIRSTISNQLLMSTVPGTQIEGSWFRDESQDEKITTSLLESALCDDQDISVHDSFFEELANIHEEMMLEQSNIETQNRQLVVNIENTDENTNLEHVDVRPEHQAQEPQVVPTALANNLSVEDEIKLVPDQVDDTSIAPAANPENKPQDGMANTQSDQNQNSSQNEVVFGPANKPQKLKMQRPTTIPPKTDTGVVYDQPLLDKLKKNPLGYENLQKSILKLTQANNKLGTKLRYNLSGHYEDFLERIKDLPIATQAELLYKANKMFFTVADKKYSQDVKITAIADFEITAKKLIPTNISSAFKFTMAGLLTAVFSIAVGAVIGAGIGILAGAWSGPGAAVTGLLGLFAGAATAWSLGVGSGAAGVGVLAGGLTSFGLFKTANAGADLCKDARQVMAEMEAPEVPKAGAEPGMLDTILETAGTIMDAVIESDPGLRGNVLL